MNYIIRKTDKRKYMENFFFQFCTFSFTFQLNDLKISGISSFVIKKYQAYDALSLRLMIHFLYDDIIFSKNHIEVGILIEMEH